MHKPREIYWPTVTLWLNRCEETHVRNCDKLLLDSAPPKIQNRTYIDVQKQSLVVRPYSCRYIALSYVWGRVPQLLLTSTNRDLLFVPGSLKTLEDSIPRVIRDAIQAVQSLDETLLWVDSLCIAQDDKSEKHVVISEMASIYDRALATIIAAHGENAEACLPGVCQDSRILDQDAKIPGTDIYISKRKNLGSLMRRSTYNRRGWTFQERLLSRRCLYFTGHQVFFECQEHLCSEDRLTLPLKSEDNEERSRRLFRSDNLIKSNLIEFGDPFASEEDRQLLRYSKIVEEYSRKQLSFSDDVLSAFAGIGTSLELLCNWTMVYGLPEQLLDRAILWEQKKNTLPREGYHSQFPTWSWSSWVGGIDYNEWTASDIHIHHTQFELGKFSWQGRQVS
ncbi:HET-domain-containing protein [Cadophora sp. DSE1049]|nr:HET-domain-containing protein [Cadophora sp. DSE1049]